MASTGLYAPTLDTSMPAFIALGESYCRVYFSLSKFSTSSSTIKSVHVSVVKQSTGQSVINKTDNAEKGRYRSSGILIINSAPRAVEDVDNYYYVDVLNEDIKSGDTVGWQPGWLYKIQLRLSEVQYQGTPGQAAWLVAQASNFSEWSAYCTVKATGQPKIVIPLFDFDSSIPVTSNEDDEIPLSLSTLDFSGTYSNDTDISETLYSYNLALYDMADDEVLEESGELYTNQYYTPNQMSYTLDTEFLEGQSYKLVLTYTTINKYTYSYKFNLVVSQDAIDSTSITAVTVDNIDKVQDASFREVFNSLTSLDQEEEEGRIGIKFYLQNSNNYNGNICLRRASSKDNYTVWSDIKIVVCINHPVNSLAMIYDNTVESGVWYKYAVQTISTNGERSITNPSDPANISPIIRDFHYAYLIGEGGKQLALRYNNTMASYTYNYSEAKTDTIGGQFPFITRNGNMKYRTFPVNGLISFNMDENQLFITDKEIYCNPINGAPYTGVINSYTNRRKEKQLTTYDFKREFDFREKVLEFLQDGKPKLFKSASEGNIIVRLMSVAAQPNQTVNRMIYSFTSTAYEVAESTLDNYIKYDFLEVGNWSSSFEAYTHKFGQLDIDLSPGENIIAKIWEKYDRSTRNLAGSRISLKKLKGLRLEFTDPPMRVYTNAGELVLGNNIQYGDNIITVRAGFSRTYVFDDSISLTGEYIGDSFMGDSVTVLKGIDEIYDEDGNIKDTIHVSVDFTFTYGEEPYVEKKVSKRTTKKNVGQLFERCKPGTNLYNELYYKYYYEWTFQFRKLSQIKWTCIEANPGAVFKIVDQADNSKADDQAAMYHDIGWTGILNLDELGMITGLSYIGMRRPDGSIDKAADCDVLIDYLYYTSEGYYKES
jgi:hypothetical protein